MEIRRLASMRFVVIKVSWRFVGEVAELAFARDLFLIHHKEPNEHAEEIHFAGGALSAAKP